MLQSFGLIGTIIFVSAYVPQIAHLAKVKNSVGISLWSWSIWSLGALLLFAYAVSKRDIVFILLTALEFIALVTVVILTIRYKPKQTAGSSPKR